MAYDRITSKKYIYDNIDIEFEFNYYDYDMTNFQYQYYEKNITNQVNKYYSDEYNKDTHPLYVISKKNKWTTILYHNIEHIFCNAELHHIKKNDVEYLYLISCDGYMDGKIDITTGIYTRYNL